MGKTFAELKAAVQEITPPHADVGIYINDAQNDLVESSNRFKRVNQSLVNGVATVPTDCLVLLMVAYGGLKLSQYPGLETPDYGSGNPIYYQRDGATIYLYPRPDAGQTDQVELAYTPKPTALVNDAQTSELEYADDALIAYAKLKIYTRKEDYYAADFWKNEYLTEKVEWLNLDAKQNRRIRRVTVGVYR